MSAAYPLAVARIGAYDIHYADEGRGFPLLLIHGLAGDHSAWTPQIAAWRGTHRVIAPDSRGAGRSSQVDEPISTEDMARDMLALLDRLGIAKAHVLGRSMGGAIAQHMALLAPERVHTLMMCASFARLDAFGRRVLSNMREVLEMTGSWAAHARHSVQNFVSADFFDANPKRIAAIEQLIGGETRLQACYVRQNHACLEHDTLARLPEIRCPTLIMGGGRDPICPLACTRWMSAAIKHAETVVFENSSHFFLMEEPEHFMNTMNGWLARHTPRAPEQGRSNMAENFTLRVNGREHTVKAEANTPLVYILRNDLKLKGTRFGCGQGNCGACTVLIDGKPVQSCDTPLWSAPGHEITTIEGLGSAEAPGRLQQAFIDEQAMQCGYCINGIIMSAEALLARKPAPSDAEIAQALERNLCRCGTHPRVLRAIKRAAGAER